MHRITIASMAHETSNIIILGAGPAGATASLFLSKAKVKHTVIDKAIFPRDKICGDALSGKVVTVLKKLNPDLIPQLLGNNVNCVGSHGILFVAPNGKSLAVPFKPSAFAINQAAGYVSKRMDFDFSLVKLLDPRYCSFIQGTEIKKIERSEYGLTLQALDAETKSLKEFQTPLLIACDGAHSVANRLFDNEHKLDREHFSAGIRAYYKNVSGMHDQNFVELHFLADMLPGYFWIFPLPNGMANVGVGMLGKTISKKKVNLKEAMLQAIRTNPTIKHRFANAELVGNLEGWGLPLGSKKRKIADDHIMLCGDAASLIDPFSGEGISNAMYTGMRAAEKALEGLVVNNFSKDFLTGYQALVYSRLWTELQLSHTLQKLCSYPALFNFVINKASKNQAFRETFSCMFDDLDLRGKFKQPSFYFKLLFG